jgi:excisionase family DNA binding protein
MEQIYLSIDEAAKKLGYKKSYLYKLVWSRTIPHYKLNGGHLLFNAAEIDAWIRRGKVATVDELQAKADALLNSRNRA